MNKKTYRWFRRWERSFLNANRDEIANDLFLINCYGTVIVGPDEIERRSKAAQRWMNGGAEYHAENGVDSRNGEG